MIVFIIRCFYKPLGDCLKAPYELPLSVNFLSPLSWRHLVFFCPLDIPHSQPPRYVAFLCICVFPGWNYFPQAFFPQSRPVVCSIVTSLTVFQVQLYQAVSALRFRPDCLFKFSRYFFFLLRQGLMHLRLPSNLLDGRL